MRSRRRGTARDTGMRTGRGRPRGLSPLERRAPVDGPAAPLACAAGPRRRPGVEVVRVELVVRLGVVLPELDLGHELGLTERVEDVLGIAARRLELVKAEVDGLVERLSGGAGACDLAVGLTTSMPFEGLAAKVAASEGVTTKVAVAVLDCMVQASGGASCTAGRR